MSRFVAVSDEFRIAIANFVPEKGKKKEAVAFVKACDENGEPYKFGKGWSALKLKALLESPNRLALIALCDAAIAEADAANKPASKPAAPVTAKPAPPTAPTVVYFTFDGANTSEAIVDVAAVRAFAMQHRSTDGAAIHVNGAWHTADKWASLGFAPPPPPVAAVEAPAVPTAPSAPVNGKKPSALEALVKSRLTTAS